MNLAKVAYISFDTVPAPKGAAIHIEAFIKALANSLGTVELVTVAANTDIASQPAWEGVKQTALPAKGATLIHRVLNFRWHLGNYLKNRYFQAIHIRSIYEGFPIALHKNKYCDRLIFEVNGLPSIELKYRYPRVTEDRELLEKLKAQEQVCLEAADLIITPSSVTRDYLRSRQISPDKIQVIPNGVDLDLFTYQVPLNYSEPFTLIYFGTLSSWQGVNLIIRALPFIQAHFPVCLNLIASASQQQIYGLKSLAQKLGVSQQVNFLGSMTQTHLVKALHQSHCSIAPLTFNDRNLVQGCCPLKVLESLATGTPVITSDLPVIRELGEPETHFIAVKPGSVAAIAESVIELKNQPEFALRLSENARKRIETCYTWEQSAKCLISAYAQLGIKRAMTC